MAERDLVRLDFERAADGAPRLACWTLTSGQRSISARPRDPCRPYQWERSGPRALALPLVRLARWKECGKLPDRVPLLSGVGRPSEATTLGDAALKIRTVTWWANMLAVEHEPTTKGAEEEAEARLRRWFAFENIQGRRADKEATVFGLVTNLPPHAVDIRMDGHPLGGPALDRLERELSATLFGSLPPVLHGAKTRVTGYLPSTGCAGSGRDTLLEQLDELYDHSGNRVLVLLGVGGAGKTTIAREWLGGRCMADSLRQDLVFCWSFYRQGYNGGPGQLLAEFYARLADALQVTITDTMLPNEVAATLRAALKAHPTFLFLDGLEVLQDGASQHATGISDAALAELLLALGKEEDCQASFVMITTRTSLKDSGSWSYPEVQHMKVRALPPGGDQNKTKGKHSILEWAVATKQTNAGSVEEAAALLAAAQDKDSGDALPTLVRRALETMRGQPDWALLIAASLFDRPAEWSALQHLLTSEPALPQLSERWLGLPDSEWESALERLQSKRLLHVDADCRVVIHPRIVQCLAEELRRSMVSAWVEGHRRLCDYFVEIPNSYTPDTVLEMEPLFRAAWHGCQAGDYRKVYDTILFPRVARGNSGYPIFALGAYETGLHLSKLLAPDYSTFAPGCELAADDQMIIIHLAALCLRYLDRLEEAYTVEQRAWARISPECTVASIGPTAVHLLRCQHIFGDLHKTGPVMRLLAKTLARTPMSSRGLKVPSSHLAIVVGFIGAQLATILWAKGHSFAARSVMRLAASRSVRLDKRGRTLVPGMACPWHALVLLDFGDWRTVEKAILADELNDSIKRNRQTGMIEMVTGRMLSSKAQSESGEARTKLATDALDHLTAGLGLVQRNHYRWWQCAFHLAIAQHHVRSGDKSSAMTAARNCMELATVNRFALMEIDSACLLSEINNEPLSPEIMRLISERGYGRAKKAIAVK